MSENLHWFLAAMSLEVEYNTAEHETVLMDKLKDEMMQMKKELENKTKVNELLLR